MAKKTRGASAASSKKQTKAAQRELKKKQRENKKKLEQQTKAASKLRRVIKTYDENSHKSDRDYIVEMLDANPAWVAKLAMVIRQGGMKILIDLESKGENDSQALDYGPCWKGKNVRTFLKLPALQAMILAKLLKGTETPTSGGWRPSSSSSTLLRTPPCPSTTCSGASGSWKSLRASA